jgi:chromosome segregation ATPase
MAYNSILDKLRVITLGNVHSLLDAVIDLNDIGSLNQYGRDLESAIAQMEEFGNGLKGSISTLQRDIAKDTVEAGRRQQDIDTLLTDSEPANDAHALAIQVQLDHLNAGIDENKVKLEQKKDQSTKTERAIGQMQAKLAEAVKRVRDLEQAKVETSALKQGAQAMDTMGKVFGGAPSMDKVGARIMQQNATAQAQFDRSMGRASDAAVNDVTVSSAEAALARRRQQLLGATKPAKEPVVAK